MKAQIVRLAILASLSPAVAADEMRISVRVVAPQSPGAVTFEREDGGNAFTLGKDASSGNYDGIVPSQVVADGDRSRVLHPFRLVVSWADSQEQLFLGLKAPIPSALNLSVYRDQALFNDAAVNAIDKLGSDRESLLQKYFRARTFHKHWRYDLSNPDYYLAIRSARLWFDASAELAKRTNSLVRLDPDVVKVMNDYEEKAKQSPSFNKRYRNYAGSGYIAGTMAQIDAADFAFVGSIPGLVAAGKHEEARQLNAKAISALVAMPEDARSNVLKRQRISLDLLQANEKSFRSQQRAD